MTAPSPTPAPEGLEPTPRTDAAVKAIHQWKEHDRFLSDPPDRPEDLESVCRDLERRLSASTAGAGADREAVWEVLQLRGALREMLSVGSLGTFPNNLMHERYWRAHEKGTAALSLSAPTKDQA